MFSFDTSPTTTRVQAEVARPIRLSEKASSFFGSGIGDGLLAPPWGMVKTKRVKRAPSMAA